MTSLSPCQQTMWQVFCFKASAKSPGSSLASSFFHLPSASKLPAKSSITPAATPLPFTYFTKLSFATNFLFCGSEGRIWEMEHQTSLLPLQWKQQKLNKSINILFTRFFRKPNEIKLNLAKEKSVKEEEHRVNKLAALQRGKERKRKSTKIVKTVK